MVWDWIHPTFYENFTRPQSMKTKLLESARPLSPDFQGIEARIIGWGSFAGRTERMAEDDLHEAWKRFHKSRMETLSVDLETVDELADSRIVARPRKSRALAPIFSRWAYVRGIYIADGRCARVRFLLSGAFGIQPGEKCQAQFDVGGDWASYLFSDFILEEGE